MALRWKLAKYVALGLGVLVVLGVVVSVVGALVGLAVSVVASIVTLLALVGVLYAGAKGVQWLRARGDDPVDSPGAESTDDGSLDRLTQRYVDGAITERELERRLELELDGPGADAIDRELERSRSE